jgi:hypothetical protein
LYVANDSSAALGCFVKQHIEYNRDLGWGAGIAAFLLTIGAIALEGARFSKLGIGGVFGWLSKDYLLGIW